MNQVKIQVLMLMMTMFSLSACASCSTGIVQSSEEDIENREPILNPDEPGKGHADNNQENNDQENIYMDYSKSLQRKYIPTSMTIPKPLLRNASGNLISDTWI